MLLWADGFSWIETSSGLSVTAQLQSRYSNASAPAVTVGELGQSCLLGQGAFTTPQLVSGDIDEYVVGFSMLATSATQANLNGPLMSFINNAFTTLQVDCLATPVLERGDFKLVIINSTGDFVGSVGPFYSNTWYYVEIRVFGTSLQVRVSGFLVFEAELSSPAPIDRVRFSLLGQMATDSFYVLDSSGQFNNDYLGPVSVDGLFPVLEFESEGWTAVGGNSILALRWVDGDSRYIDGSNGGSIRLRMDPAFRSSAGSIAGLFITYVGSGDPVDLIVNGASYSSGPLGAGGTRHEILETDPGTQAPWDYRNLAAAFFGFDQP